MYSCNYNCGNSPNRVSSWRRCSNLGVLDKVWLSTCNVVFPCFSGQAEVRTAGANTRRQAQEEIQRTRCRQQVAHRWAFEQDPSVLRSFSQLFSGYRYWMLTLRCMLTHTHTCVPRLMMYCYKCRLLWSRCHVWNIYSQEFLFCHSMLRFMVCTFLVWACLCCTAAVQFWT